tara:strand:+ start:1354 stop:1545 length:192 start_codon:yes stop_codon:yes gene_type:complete
MSKKIVAKYKQEIKLAQASIVRVRNSQKKNRKNYLAHKEMLDKFVKDKKAEIVKLKKLITKHK